MGVLPCRASLSNQRETWQEVLCEGGETASRDETASSDLSACLSKWAPDGDYRVSPRAQEIRQRWGMGERAQTRLSSKCPELSELLLKLKAEGR